MKRQILGWAVVFAVTLLLSACASEEARVSNYNKMSGADATMAHSGEQEQQLANIYDTFTYSPILTDETSNDNDLTDNNTVGTDTVNYQEGDASADLERDNYEYLSL